MLTLFGAPKAVPVRLTGVMPVCIPFLFGGRMTYCSMINTLAGCLIAFTAYAEWLYQIWH